MSNQSPFNSLVPYLSVVGSSTAASTNHHQLGQWQLTASTAPPVVYPLALLYSFPAKEAEDLMAQYDHDGILVKDGKLLFGAYASITLRMAPLEYLLGANKAIRTLRRAILMEVRRRRVVEKLVKDEVPK